MEPLQATLARDRHLRTETVKAPIVHTLTGPATELLPPGCGVIILADAGSDSFDALERALSANAITQINEVVTQNKQTVNKLRKVSSREALGVLEKTGNIVDVSYDSKTLAVNLFTVRGVGFTRVFFPFAGGDFDAQKFKYISLAKNGASADKVMVVLHQPTLSRIELQALKNITKETSSMQFGQVGGVMLCTPAAFVATVTAGLLVAAVATAAGNCSAKFGKFGQEVINPEINAGQLLSVKQLVQLRDVALSQKTLR